MANERLAAARELIKAKRYAEARQVLKVIADHPTARVWLAKLDEIAPVVAEDDPFAVFDAPPVRPAVKPADAIFDPNPRFDPLPKPKEKQRSRRPLLIMLALVIVGIVGAIWLLLTFNGPGLITCIDSDEGKAALKDFLDTAETAAATARVGLGPVILELQRHQRRYDQANHPVCARSVVDKIRSGIRSVVEGFQDFAAQRGSQFALQRAHDSFKDASDSNFLIASDIRLTDFNLFILGISSTATPYRDLATQRPYPTDAPTPTVTAIG